CQGQVARYREEIGLYQRPKLVLVERGGGMEAGKHPAFTELASLSMDTADRLPLEPASHGEAPEGDDELRGDQLYLLVEERCAGCHLVGHGIAIPRRPALDHIGDVDVGPSQA